MVLCALLSVVLAVAGPSADAQADWNQIGLDIDGEAAGDESGRSVAMNAAGDTVIIGAVDNDGNGDDSGHARVFRLAPEPTGSAAPVPYPEPFTQTPEPTGAPYGWGTAPNPVAVSPETPTAEPPAAPVASFTG